VVVAAVVVEVGVVVAVVVECRVEAVPVWRAPRHLVRRP
jgi:hypothetical protein